MEQDKTPVECRPKGKHLIFSSRVRGAYGKMTKTEKLLADYLLEDPTRILDATARSLSEHFHISPATVVRFCRSCGFSGLTDMKLSVRREDKTISASADGEKYTHVHTGDPVSLVLEKVLGYHNMIIHDMMSGWNEQAYEYAAEAILHARRVIVMGQGGSRCTATGLFHILTNLGINCELHSDSVFEIMRVGTLEEGDAAIGISFTGRLRDTVESLMLAKERGAVTIGLVGDLDSPIMKYVDIPLVTTKLDKDYYDSALSIRVSEFIGMEILCTLISMKLNLSIAPTTAREHVVSIRRIWEEESEPGQK